MKIEINKNRKQSSDFYRMITDHGENLSEKSLSLNFGHPFDSRGCLKFGLGNLYYLRLYFW